MGHELWDIVGVGENSVDLVYRLPGPPASNSKMRALDHRVLPGGQVATMLCTSAKLGLRTTYIGVFGNDANGDLIRSTLEAHGVDTTHAHTRDAANRHAVILLDDRGERTVLWHRDPQLTMMPADVQQEAIERARVLHVDSVDEEAAIAAARHARAAGVQVTTDIDRVTARTPALIAAATVPILAEDVPRVLTGEADPERALRQLRNRHDGRLCVTLGAAGAMLLERDRLYRVPAFPVAAVDTTGAGDVFRGALVYALLRGDDAETMLRFATAAAALSCTREGAIGGIPTLGEINALMGT